MTRTGSTRAGIRAGAPPQVAALCRFAIAAKTAIPRPMARIEMPRFADRPQPSPTNSRTHASDGRGAVAPTITPHRVGSKGFAYRSAGGGGHGGYRGAVAAGTAVGDDWR